jgi:hypothetical protein
MREQIKLIYQCMSASEGSLAGYFEDNMAVSVRLREISGEVRRIALATKPGTRVSNAHLDQLLAMNKELRRLYDTTASRYIESFDSATAPLMGWRNLFEREMSE